MAEPPSNLNLTEQLAAYSHVLCSLLSMMDNSSHPEYKSTRDMCENVTFLEEEELTRLMGSDPEDKLKKMLVYTAYALIVVVSLIGNLMVVWAIFSKRRMRTTVNVFIGNLAISDLMMTIFNIPFSCTRLLMEEWIFGDFVCHAVPFVQVVGVYVSTITMAYIAIDRYQAIMSPMGGRISTKIGTKRSLAIIWILSMVFSTPFMLFNRVVKEKALTTRTRCMVQYPSPEEDWRKSINIITFLLQFAIPFIILTVLYAIVCVKIWSRQTIGATTLEQQNRQMMAKRKTIFMLLLVAIVFAVCWLPLNLYYLLVDFANYNSYNVYLASHWIAMSSVCYNPFIYFCLNRRFKQVLKSLSCFSTCFDPTPSPTSLPPSNNHQNFIINMSKLIFGRSADASISGLATPDPEIARELRTMRSCNDDSSSNHRLGYKNVETVLVNCPSNSILMSNNNSGTLRTLVDDDHKRSSPTLTVRNGFCNQMKQNSFIELCQRVDDEDELNCEVFPMTTSSSHHSFEHTCLTKIADPDKYDVILCESRLKKLNKQVAHCNNIKNNARNYDMTVRAARYVDSSSF